MKKAFLIAALGMVVGGTCMSQRNNDALGGAMNNTEDFDDAMESFERGGATNAEEYFFGVQAMVVIIDVKLRAVEYLDSMDAKPEEITSHCDDMLKLIKNCKKAMQRYEGKGWTMQDKLQALTIEWVDAVKMLVNNYIKPLAIPFSIPDKDWKDADFDFYDKYLAAYEIYLEIDNRWVDFQYEFAAANGFELSAETIDMDPLIKEEVGQ
ncbi:MAG: hypothetical protein HYZ14_09960 [Bacteroidetes bacterium]|nr:hypothetical protein [Bacteroidota bacterium]